VARLRRAASAVSLAFVAAGAITMAACTSTQDVLQVVDPDIINPIDVQSAAGANAVRLGALQRLTTATSGGELFLLSGLLGDEWNNGDSYIDRQAVDQRVINNANSFLLTANRSIFRARLSATQAVDLLKQFNPLGPAADVAEMYYVRAYLETLLGEDYCNGLVLSTVVNGIEQYGSPTTTVVVLQTALAHADSGVALITGTTANDLKILYALQVVRGRILVDLDRKPEAATAVASVPTSFKYVRLHSITTVQNQVWAFNNVARRYSVSTAEGTNGLNFATANDPRLPICQGGDVVCKANGVTLKVRDDASAFPLYIQLLWPTGDSSVTIASGIEARMIEAEAAYKAGNTALFIQKLNQARTEGGVAGLTANLTDPGTNVTRENLLFRERAFWLFGRGYRLGDMRRLIRQYGRGAETVFPTGPWHKGGNYGTDVNFPVPQAESNNANTTGPDLCTDHNA
jgi:hypothetical protein